MRAVLISYEGITHTLRHLQEAGRRGTECVVLWLGREDGALIRVEQVYLPAQIARTDVFRIPPDSMRALLFELSSNQLMIAAQVHSHPTVAFHSQADNTWAIVRHIDALSLVVPDFALKTTPARFMGETKMFRLTADNHWREINGAEVGQWLIIR